MENDIRQEHEQELLELKWHLTSHESDIGDWKIIKYQEYMLAGLQPPYDINELNARRQAVRDRINEIKAGLAAQ